jgi:hypothetical protein
MFSSDQSDESDNESDDDLNDDEEVEGDDLTYNQH